jgi:hypothetical protein
VRSSIIGSAPVPLFPKSKRQPSETALRALGRKRASRRKKSYPLAVSEDINREDDFGESIFHALMGISHALALCPFVRMTARPCPFSFPQWNASSGTTEQPAGTA